MIISDRNRYIFIEVPQTASTAVAQELMANYGGKRILRRHADYGIFYRTASAIERSYRVFATIRNPLDIVVSKFVKARDKHGELYGQHGLKNAPWGYRFRKEMRELRFIESHGPDFEAYVRKFYRWVYNSRACLLPPHARVLRYEQLESDFTTYMNEIGLDVIRPIPASNVTSGRDRDFSTWYSPSLRSYASKVFGPYLLQWGYNVPADWPHINSSSLTRSIFNLDTSLRRFYFRHIHYGFVMPVARRRVK